MRRYTVIDHIAQNYLEINWYEYGVANCIFNMKNSERSPIPGWCSLTQKEIGKFIGFSRNKVNKIIQNLIDKGIVEQGTKSLLRTTVIWDDAHELDPETQEEIIRNLGRQKAPHQAPKGAQEARNGADTYISNSKSNLESNAAQAEIEIWPTFEDFWNAGLAKQDKDRSLRYWKKIKQADREKIMENIPAYLESNEREFLRGTASYLYKKTWNNEIINRRKAKQIVNSGITQAGTEQRIRDYYDESE